MSTPPFFAKFTAAAYLVLYRRYAVRSLEFSSGCDTLNGFEKFPLLNMDMLLLALAFVFAFAYSAYLY